MKKIILLALVTCSSMALRAQEQNTSPHLLLRPYFENGVDFIQNAQLKQNYQTQSKYYWGFGLQLGHPEKNNVIPYVQYTHSSFEIRTEKTPNMYADSALVDQKITSGLLIPISKFNHTHLVTRIGYSYSMINESFNQINSGSHGFQIGLGIEREIIRNSRISLNLIYNYQKTSVSNFRDFDMIKLALGFVI